MSSVSASNLAHELGVSVEEVLEVLADVTGRRSDASDAAVPEDTADLVRQRFEGSPPATVSPVGHLQARGGDLIAKAFEVARAAGKPDWRRMSAAVLKNRLLDLTHRSFDERDWGFESFTEWLTLFSDLVRVDHTKRPPVVELLAGGETPAATQPSEAPAAASVPTHPWRVRRDLWQALTTPDTEGRWAWVEGAAVLSADGEAPSGLVLPHITAREMQELRREFISRLPDQLRGDAVNQLLYRWASDLLPSATIPPRHRALWNATLKRAVVERLHVWFRERGLAPPDDLVEEVEPEHERHRGSTEELRSFVVRCVEVMSQRELEQIPLPAAAVLRARRQ